MTYNVYELFPDGYMEWRYNDDDRLTCEMWVSHHEYDINVQRAHSYLIIKEA